MGLKEAPEPFRDLAMVRRDDGGMRDRQTERPSKQHDDGVPIRKAAGVAASAKAARNPKPALWRSRSFAMTRTVRLATRTPPASHLVRLSSRNRARSCGSRAAAVSVFRPWLESASPIAPSPARASVRPLLRCRLAWRKRRGHRPLGVVAINCLPLNEFFAADHDFVQCTNACCNAA